jgi:hypothetical protein
MEDWSDGECAYFLLERIPRISNGIESFFEWVELFPGVRLWWHQETYTDQELMEACQNDEHYYALRWVESRSRRMNFGYVCELEIIPSETRQFFDEEGLSELMIDDINIHQLYSVFTSSCLLMMTEGKSTQMRSCGSLNRSWRFITAECETPFQINLNHELSNDGLWEKIENQVELIEVEEWELILPLIWKAGYTLFSDNSGRYADFLEFYTIAMQTEDLLERNARFCRCLETIIRRSDGIAKNLQERIPLLLEISDGEIRKEMGLLKDVAQEHLDFFKSLIKDAWTLRNKFWHGQTLNDALYDKSAACVQELPHLLFWINRGLIALSRIPSNDEFNRAQDSGTLDWNISPKWGIIKWPTIDDWIYRIDGTYDPKSIESYKSIGGKEGMDYCEYLDKFGDK